VALPLNKAFFQPRWQSARFRYGCGAALLLRWVNADYTTLVDCGDDYTRNRLRNHNL
jgi:hypothetical protein